MTMVSNKTRAESDILEEKLIRIAFHSIPGVGSGRLRQLIAYFGSALKAWQATENGLRKLGTESWVNLLIQQRSQLDPRQIENDLAQKEIKTVIPEEKHYPALLRELADAPPLLYYKGKLEPGEEGIAIVGSRKATPYGRAAAEFLGKELAKQGLVVVSGLARGIDTAAHKGALAGKGKTWAILGSGLDYLYPPENRRLAEQILLEGALLSEFPPGVPPEPQFFPMRNRLISGVAQGVVVVEAALRSGALITVDCALEQGREVFAIPGPIFSGQSKGCHQLLRQGAKLVEDVEDILSELSFAPRDLNTEMIGKDNSKRVNNLDSKRTKNLPEQLEILSFLSDLPLHIDQIVWQSSLTSSQVALLLLELQLAGEIEQLPGQRYVLAHKC
ncbi:DNA-processing protein DprA [Desulfitobacterium sp.]|uniref:DNA-processing protein DprA n=1 Tax=Desulfitobacterium sp. TaxID=49981 RepID=UPI002BF01297|nr:DNA-processing protein DprA [Desulfitobacterium sp.]HVJ47784.1 DNA-processing protein DprA [Desulfitobacterium sp.]